MLVSVIIPFNAQVAASTILTVQEAIENNSGTGTVKGYIVGHAISGSNVKFEAPFSNDFNFVLADSPTEKDLKKTLQVQIPTTFRGKFGLQTNPDIIGKEVIVTGSLAAYNGVPGLRTPTAMNFVDEAPPEPKPFEGIEGLKIHDIQGESHVSPYVDKNVKGVEGIVTHVVDASNFYMQTETADDNPKTAEGILIYKPSHGARVGDFVKVDGQVKEWVLDGYSDKLQTDLAMTEINAQNGNVIKVSSGNELPAAVVIGKDVFPPTEVVDNDQFGVFDPEEDGIDFYESLEGMRVALEDPTVLGPQKYGELAVITEQVEGKAYTKNGTPLLTRDNQNPERMHLLLDNRNYVAKAGDQFDGTVTGVMSYGFSNFKILVNTAELPQLNEREITAEVTTIEHEEDQLTVGVYNIENFTALDPIKMDKIAASIVENLKSPDILGLVEMQDNNGATNNGVTDAEMNYVGLINAIKANGGPTYAWTDIAPENNKDGGAPGGNIRVGYLYNPERVTLAEGEKGDATTAVGYENGSLTLNPGRVDPTNPAFNSSRKPLAAQFTFKGEDVIVINNHFNSKGGDQAIFGKHQPPVLSSEVQRMKIATILNEFVADIHAKNENANVVVMGDLNDFEFSNPLQALKGTELTNLVEMLPPSERYTYIYQGNAQVLDHILVSNRLADSSKIDIVNFNSPYMEEHGRASDHDALVAQLDLLAKEVENKTFDLRILHTNDTHANVEKYPRVVTAVNELRAEKDNSLLVDAGDVFSGTLYFNKYLGQADLYFMNLLGYDAMTFGNHEFDKDSKTLADFVSKMNFPIVSANVNVRNDADLSPLFKDVIGGSNEEGEIFPAIIKEMNGEKVGIFGLTTEDTVFLANPSDDIVFENFIEKSKETVKMLEDEGVNKIVVLSHLGFNPDRQLAAAVDGIDVIVGGHSHTALAAPLFVEKEEPTLIVQTGEYLNNLGLLDVTFDENGVISEYDGKLVATKDFAEDEATRAKVEEFKAPLEEIRKTVVGHTTVELDGVNANVRSKETNLGNLITDGMVARANEAGVKTHIAVQNGGGIRASIDEGDITLGEVFTVLPFGNNLVTLDLTGSELLAALEHSVSQPGQGRFLQVSGIKFKYDNTLPVGEKVWQVEVKTDNGYEALKTDQLYTVATNAFIADGGDGYTMFKAAKDAGRINELLLVDYEVFTSYLEKFESVSPTVEGRIIQGSKPEDTTPEPPVGPEAPVVEQVTSKDKMVRGTAEKGTTISVKVGDKEIGTKVLTNNGKGNEKFQVIIPAQTVGTVLKVTAIDKDGNESAVTEVVVVKK